jgi:hypothetical protein
MPMRTNDDDDLVGSPSEVVPLRALMQLLYQQWRCRAVYAATHLGIADVLGDGSRTVAELAAVTGCHALSLYRLLRALARIGVFVELDGQWGRHRWRPRRVASRIAGYHPGIEHAALLDRPAVIDQPPGPRIYSARRTNPERDPAAGDSTIPTPSPRW